VSTKNREKKKKKKKKKEKKDDFDFPRKTVVTRAKLFSSRFYSPKPGSIGVSVQRRGESAW